MGTFHSVFLRILRTYADRIGFDSKFTIYDTADSRNLIKAIIKDMSPDGIVRDLNENNKRVERGLDEKLYKPATVQAIISNAKNALITPKAYAASKELIEADIRSKKTAYKRYICRILESLCSCGGDGF